MASWSFEAIFAALILTNSIFIGPLRQFSRFRPPAGVEVHYTAHNPGDVPISFFIIDQSYAFLFVVELAMRVLAEGRPFFWTSPNLVWNYLDIAINLTSLVNLASALAVVSESSDFKASGNVRIIRILRLTRVIRVVRIVKIVRFIRALRRLGPHHLRGVVHWVSGLDHLLTSPSGQDSAQK